MATAHNEALANDKQKEMLNQKFALLDSMLNRSSSTNKILTGDNEEAKELVAQTKMRVVEAHSNFDAGDLDGAEQGINDALKLFYSAKATARKSQSSTMVQRSRYQELLQAIELLRELNDSPLPPDTVDLLSQARQHTQRDDYRQANKLLSRAYELLSADTAKAFDMKTVVYSLEFATPREEYEYELRRHDSSKKLISFMRERNNREGLDQILERYLQAARDLEDSAHIEAQRGDYPQAIQSMEKAGSEMQRALRVLGARL